MTSAANDLRDTLTRLGVQPDWADTGVTTRSPVDGSEAGALAAATPDAVEAAIAKATEAFSAWRRVPAPRRGELVRLLGEELRTAKDDLARLVTLEAGKITSEGAG